MGESVIRDRVATSQNFFDKMWLILRARTDNKKSRSSAMTLKYFENLPRVRGGRSVVDGDPDFAL